MRKIQDILQKYYMIEVVIWAVCLDIIVELLSRDSLESLLHHICTQPIYFAYNVLIIVATLSLSGFFKRKRIASVVIAGMWLGLGIGNYVVLSYRITPFAAIDLSIMEWNMDFLEPYLSGPLVTLAVAAVLVIIVSLCFMVKKSKVSEVHLKRTILVSSMLLFLVYIINYGFVASGVYEERISNMQESYDKFGFVSCFTRSATERGIDEPDDYSPELIDAVLTNLDVVSEEVVVKPNIVVVQLESFFDPDILIDTELSENPIPTFTALSNECSSGKLEVSVVGAGTANTEFEVLTSMSVDFFGTGEYPYETVLQEDTCESAAYNLKELGYTSFALHNNTGTFYERYKVYPNLGFDTFVSSEFMTNITTTPEGWIKDECLTPEIQKCLESTEEQDFVFAVSVQGHGPFPEEEMENPIITVEASPFDTELENQLEYYVNQIYEMDLFIEELVTYLSGLEEPTVLVLYGDHIPSLDIDAAYYENGDNYQTSYVFWANYELEEKDQDLTTYQLLPMMFEQIDIREGSLTQLHQDMRNDDMYLEYLKIMQYDLLYGESLLYDGIEYEPTEMTMGVDEIEFDIYMNDKYVYLISSEITESSKVFVNDKVVESERTKNCSLRVPIDEIGLGDQIVIKQVSPDGTVLAESKTLPTITTI